MRRGRKLRRVVAILTVSLAVMYVAVRVQPLLRRIEFAKVVAVLPFPFLPVVVRVTWAA